MERKATLFIHRLAERLSDDSDAVPDSILLKKTFKEAVESMKPGKLRQELLVHFSLYFRKLLHSIHKMASSPGESEPTDEESSNPPASHSPPRQAQAPTLFNLFAREGERLKEQPSAQKSQERREVLLRLCATTGEDGFKLIESHLLGDEISYSQLKELSVVLIGQHHPEAVLRYLSLAVKNLSGFVDKAVETEDVESCTELNSYISQLLMLARFRCQLTEVSFPRDFTPTIECIQSALLSMAIDLSAIVSRSSDDLHKRSRQVVAQVLLHFNHSPAYLLDVLLQITSSSRDAEFLEPLYRRILFNRPVIATNSDFIKFVHAVRGAKSRLYTLIPTEVDSLFQEACRRTPPSLVVWLQETAPQWLSKVRGTSKVNGNKAITRFLLEGLDEEDFEELISLLTSTDETNEGEEESGETTQDLFFVDKSQDTITGVLPDEDGMIPEWAEAESDLEEEINLADELLAELDRDMGRQDESERVISERADGESDEEKNGEEMEGEEDSDGMMDISIMTSGRKSPELFPSSEEISFEEQRALDLELSLGQTSKSPGGTNAAGGTKESSLSEEAVAATPRKKRDRRSSNVDRDSLKKQRRGNRGGADDSIVRGDKSAGPKAHQNGDIKESGLSEEVVDATPREERGKSCNVDWESLQEQQQRGLQGSVEKQRKQEMKGTPDRGQVVKQSERELRSIPNGVSGVRDVSPPQKPVREGWNLEEADHSDDVDGNGDTETGRIGVVGTSYIYGGGTSPRNRQRKARRRAASEGASSQPGEGRRLSPSRRQHLRKTSLDPRALQESLGDAQTEPSNDVKIYQGPDIVQDNTNPSDSESEVVFNLQKAEDRKKQLKVRKGPPNPKMTKARQRYFSPKMLRRTRMREAKWGEVMQRGRELSEQEDPDGGKQEESKVVPSSELEERESAQRGSDRLSFPSLPPDQLRKRSLSLSRRKAGSKSPKLVLAVAESDEGSVNDRGGPVDNDQSKMGRGSGVVFGRPGLTRRTVEGGMTPRRSQRVRVSSTSSIESGRSVVRERRKMDLKSHKMNTRSARVASR